MNTLLTREPRHGSLKLAALLLPAWLLAGCYSGVSGHAPGLAGVQSQDPGTLNFPLAYVKRPAPASTPNADIDVRDLITSTSGGDLYIRAQASPGSVETNVTMPVTKGMGDVRDLDVSPDGKKLVFSLRLPLNPNRPNTDVTQPIFLLHVMNADGTGIHQISFNTNHDFAPSVLANGQIVFSRYESINGDQISLYRAN